MSVFSLVDFQADIQKITNAIADKPLDKNLEKYLNDEFGGSSDLFAAIEAACHAGIDAGELCKQEAGGIKYGRTINPSQDLSGYSVDLVYMDDVVGPHHRHPNGEIDMIMPIAPAAKFDGHGRGWLVYEPDSAHKPTLTDGDALVLYLLPQGAIEFTRQ